MTLNMLIQLLYVFTMIFLKQSTQPNIKGGLFHLNMLSTTCHIYFGKVTGATTNGRFATKSISDGTSPSHGLIHKDHQQ
jgi:formate C-acetyltransferase